MNISAVDPEAQPTIRFWVTALLRAACYRSLRDPGNPRSILTRNPRSSPHRTGDTDVRESRRTTITPSRCQHEREALQPVRTTLPNAEPYRAWCDFTFTANTGHVRVDLPDHQRSGLYGPENGRLPKILSELLVVPPQDQRHRITPELSRPLDGWLHKVGIAKSRSHLQVGTWEFTSPLASTGTPDFDNAPLFPSPSRKVLKSGVYLAWLHLTRLCPRGRLRYETVDAQRVTTQYCGSQKRTGRAWRPVSRPSHHRSGQVLFA